MARIFYITATGRIYGVHPGAFTGSLPPGIDFIDVVETPDKIAWPDARGENYNKVQSGALETAPFEGPPEDRIIQAIRIIAAGNIGKVAAIEALLGLKP